MNTESHPDDENFFYEETPSVETPELSQEMIDRHFKKNNINIDALNAWAYMSIRISLPNGLKKIDPVPHYEEYFRKHYPGCAKYIIERTSKESMNEFNRLADEFNKDLERIKKENDIQTIRDYLNKIQKLLS